MRKLLNTILFLSDLPFAVSAKGYCFLNSKVTNLYFAKYFKAFQTWIKLLSGFVSEKHIDAGTIKCMNEKLLDFIKYPIMQSVIDYLLISEHKELSQLCCANLIDINIRYTD